VHGRDVEPFRENTIMKLNHQPVLLAAALLCLAAAPSSAQTTGPVQYQLDDPAGYTEGCYPPCLCPIWFTGDVNGTFVLQYTMSDPAGFDHYDVLNVHWLRGLGTTVDTITGQGEYLRGGQVALQERLTLDLSLNGNPPEHFDSGLIPAQSPFPSLDLPISLNGMYCYDKVYQVSASPFGAGSPYCFGDGTGTACPCGNSGAAGNGCANSVNASGANLIGQGTASLSNDTVVLISTGTPNASVLFFQGTQRVNGGAGVVFGDGLRCAAGTVVRLKTLPAVNGEARVPGPTDPHLSLMGGIAAPGTYDYQAWYRNAADFCTIATFNLTNGYELNWTP
jgi:hypothetical protein